MASAQARAAAALDTASGRVIGYALGNGVRAAQVELALDGRPVAKQLALMHVDQLGADMVGLIGAPPTGICGFAFKIPMNASGTHLTVSTRQGRQTGNTILLDKTFDAPSAMARFREGAIMSDSVLIDLIRLHQGVLRAEVTSPGAVDAPKIALRLRGDILTEARLISRGAGVWDLAADLPTGVLGDGVVVLELTLPDGSVAASYPIAAGAALIGDLASEVASLRAELDQLKRSFRGAMAAGVLTRDERPMIVAEALTQVDHLLELRDRRELVAKREAQATDWDEDGAAWELDD